MKNNFLQACLILLSIVLFIGSTNQASAQLSGFKLSEYKNPTYRYQLLDLGFNLGSGLTKLSTRYDDTSFQGSTQNSKSFQSNLEANYSLTENSPTYQGDQNITLGLRTGISGHKSLLIEEWKYNTNLNTIAFQFSWIWRLNNTNSGYITEPGIDGIGREDQQWAASLTGKLTYSLF